MEMSSGTTSTSTPASPTPTGAENVHENETTTTKSKDTTENENVITTEKDAMPMANTSSTVTPVPTTEKKMSKRQSDWVPVVEVEIYESEEDVYLHEHHATAGYTDAAPPVAAAAAAAKTKISAVAPVAVKPITTSTAKAPGKTSPSEPTDTVSPVISPASALPSPVEVEAQLTHMRTSQGTLRKTVGLNTLLRLVWKLEPWNLRTSVMQLLYNTCCAHQGTSFAQTIVESKMVVLLRSWVVPGIKEKQDEFLLEAFRLLALLPLTLEDLKKHSWGKIVRSCAKHENQEIQSLAAQMMESWKKLISEDATNGDSGSKRSRESSPGDTNAPSVPAATEPPKKIKKLVATPAATKPLPPPSSSATVAKPSGPLKRPASTKPAPVDIFSLWEEQSAPKQKKQKPAATITRTQPATLASSATSSLASTPLEAKLTPTLEKSSIASRIPSISKKTGKPKKVVSWAPPAVMVTTHWINTDEQVAPTLKRSLRDFERGEARTALEQIRSAMKEQTYWRTPTNWDLPDKVLATLERESLSTERAAQREREARELGVFYMDVSDIPETPREPPVADLAPNEEEQPRDIPVQRDTPKELSSVGAANTPEVAQLLQKLLSATSSLSGAPPVVPGSTAPSGGSSVSSGGLGSGIIGNLLKQMNVPTAPNANVDPSAVLTTSTPGLNAQQFLQQLTMANQQLQQQQPLPPPTFPPHVQHPITLGTMTPTGMPPGFPPTIPQPLTQHQLFLQQQQQQQQLHSSPSTPFQQYAQQQQQQQQPTPTGRKVARTKCKFFQKGACKHGAACRFLHEL